MTASTTTNSMASQKSGMATPRLLPTETARSIHERGRSPATMPAGMPMTTARIMPPAAMLTVTGSRSRMPAATLWFLNSELPSCPWKHPASQRQYWAKKGWSRWRRWRMWATSAGEARAPPARVRAGSPGMSSTRLNTASEMMISSGIMISRRRPMKVASDPPDDPTAGAQPFLM